MLFELGWHIALSLSADTDPFLMEIFSLQVVSRFITLL